MGFSGQTGSPVGKTHWVGPTTALAVLEKKSFVSSRNLTAALPARESE